MEECRVCSFKEYWSLNGWHSKNRSKQRGESDAVTIWDLCLVHQKLHYANMELEAQTGHYEVDTLMGLHHLHKKVCVCVKTSLPHTHCGFAV